MVRDPVRILAAGVFLLTAVTPVSAQTGVPDDAEIPRPHIPLPAEQAPYDFSDELGGFAILGVSGVGTREDPVRILQALKTASPVTLVIRATRPINPFGLQGAYATGTIHMVLEITNETGAPWIGLELELQEHYTRPSVYGDGLSFDQRRQEKTGAVSAAFASARHDFEPFDRLLFEQGALNPRAHTEFRFLVTDLTPVPTFYIKLDPRIPAS